MEKSISYVLFIFFLLLFAFYANACGGKSKCSYSVCRESFQNYRPNPSPGACIWQKSKATHSYSTYTRSSGCPSNTKCTKSDDMRYYCSCKQIDQCWWGSWGEWTGTIPRGQCGQQKRYRRSEKKYTYAGRVGSCNGVVSKCPKEYDHIERKWCNCRKAEICSVGQWTSWSPVVSAGKCVTQTRYQDNVPTYKYIQQENSCFGINPSCSKRVTDNRKFCSCPYKECIEGGWTAWELHTWTGKCPSERRVKRYRSIEKFRNSYGTCQGIGPQSCPDPVGSVREKEITCPGLPKPNNGIHRDQACDGVNSKCQAICQVQCNSGYYLKGLRYVTCTGHGKWNGELGTCVDAIAPDITCPQVKSYGNSENKDYRIIELPDVKATDNSGINPKISVSHKSPLKVYIGKPVKVIYTASDEAGNQKSCYVHIEVKDIEPPKIMSCPSDKIFNTGKIPHQVFWGEPQFHDNADGKEVSVYPSHKNGDYFSRGKHEITYLARDKALNYVKCIFTIQVELMQCPLYDPPKFGSSTCNIRKEGVIETHLCTVSCKKDKWFMKGPQIPQLFNFYVCGENGQWRGQDVFDPSTTTFFVPIEKGKTPWPDCTDGQNPDGVTMEFQIFAGNCKNEEQMLKLKQDFVNAIKNDVIINNLFCTTSKENCVLENFIVHCNSNSLYWGYAGDTTVVSFTLALRSKSISKVQLTKLQSLAKSFSGQKNTFKTKIGKLAGSLLNTQSASIQVQDAEVGCKPGYEYGFVNGSINEKKCLECPRGTYYDVISKRCEVCETGYYQTKEASLSCIKCPPGTSTFGSLAHDFHECKVVCPPGTYSDTGIESCKACPVSTYQPLTRSRSCIKCPAGKVTKEVGATTQSECSELGVEIKIRSEGCNDPGIIKDTCGTATIVVNGKDLSPHKRGINFVVLDYKTGKHVISQAFDWHRDYHSCTKTLSFIDNLQKEVIVLAAVQDEATTNAFSNCHSALRKIGGIAPFQREYRSSFALVGYKGNQAHPSWITQKKSGFGKGPTTLEIGIKLLK